MEWKFSLPNMTELEDETRTTTDKSRHNQLVDSSGGGLGVRSMSPQTIKVL